VAPREPESQSQPYSVAARWWLAYSCRSLLIRLRAEHPRQGPAVFEIHPCSVSRPVASWDAGLCPQVAKEPCRGGPAGPARFTPVAGVPAADAGKA
jgi:hypothetical protein